jgi:hypothetical protein
VIYVVAACPEKVAIRNAANVSFSSKRLQATGAWPTESLKY